METIKGIFFSEVGISQWKEKLVGMMGSIKYVLYCIVLIRWYVSEHGEERRCGCIATYVKKCLI